MKKLGLYFHIPFCVQKCLYCDFNSKPKTSEDLVQAYLNSLKKEIEVKSQSVKEYIIDSIFIGGGTPTYISCMQLCDLLKQIKSSFNIDKNCEISCEANPGTVDFEKLKMMKESGINRLSIGLQSADDTILKQIGRIHNFNEFLTCYTEARSAGFNNINIDIMFGLPNQTLNTLKGTLDAILKLNPEHISAYSLILEEETPLYEMNLNKKLKLPDEDEEEEMYEYSIERLKKNGLEQYEISNFSKEGKECRQNLKYWSCDEYLGFGVSAHSYLNSVRWGNIANINEYIKKSSNENEIIESKEELTEEDKISEFMFMNLRKTKGVPIQEFLNRFNKSIFEVYGEIIEKYKKLNLINLTENYVFLTTKGIEISNTIMADFILG
jgi:oxygen-independent coproporphyrinogen-3 oxidase